MRIEEWNLSIHHSGNLLNLDTQFFRITRGGSRAKGMGTRSWKGNLSYTKPINRMYGEGDPLEKMEKIAPQDIQFPGFIGPLMHLWSGHEVFNVSTMGHAKMFLVCKLREMVM